MNSSNGYFVVLEGTDGSGKSTQLKKLVGKLKAHGYEAVTFDFPQYSQPSSHFVREYLSGNYGSPDQVGPYTASLFYALDRFETSAKIRRALEQGKIVLTNRFTGSNMAHQGTKFVNPEQRRGFFVWLDNLEFQLLGIPRPDLNLVLRVPAEISQELIEQKIANADTVRDIHEADFDHLRRAVEVYDDLCNLFPKDFSRIDCVREDGLLDDDTIGNLIWEKLTPRLPQPTGQPGHTPFGPTADNPYVKQLASGTIITNSGYKFLEEAVTSKDGAVYGFYPGQLSSETIAAAMARLESRGDDLRLIILDEFAAAIGRDEQLTTGSSQRFTSAHMVVENASALLTNRLEWCGLTAHTEKSARWIKFEERDAHGNFSYYVPPQLDATTKNTYCDIMDKMFDNYSEILKKVKNTEGGREGARLALPAATKSTVGIFASGPALEELIIRLQSDDLPEAEEIGAQLLHEARKLIPNFLSDFDPEPAVTRRRDTAKSVRKLANAYLPDNYSMAAQSITLTDFWPKNELDLVAYMLFQYSDQPLETIRSEVDLLSYDKKLEIFTAYTGNMTRQHTNPLQALNKARYSWDIVSEFATFCEILRGSLIDNPAWQQLTPRYGYETPRAIEDAGISDLFESNYDLSLQLYSILQQAGFAQEAQYATLLGHKLRWQISLDGQETIRLLSNQSLLDSESGKLLLSIQEKLAEKHPLLAETIHQLKIEDSSNPAYPLQLRI